MKLNCEYCGFDWNIGRKKYSSKPTQKSVSIAICPACGKKNFYKIIEKYSNKK